MLKLAMKVLIIFIGLLTFTDAEYMTNAPILVTLLTGITLSAFSQYYDNPKLNLGAATAYLIICIFLPSGLPFLPIFFFDIVPHIETKFLFLMPAIFVVTGQLNVQLLLTSTAILMLAWMLELNQNLDVANKEIRDTNTSQKIILTSKNQKLLEQQNDMLHMTKLQERNRIARDIHDIIGHSLSRALLQTGALAAINQDPNLKSAIEELKVNLTDSMNQVRNSIHDLKDDSVDLKVAVTEILAASGFKTILNYDVENSVPNTVKNCFLIVLKESVTNTSKHSDATKLTLTIAEHPVMYQFLLVDNGTVPPPETGHGIGLQNIHERVSELGGYSRLGYQNGFRTFITIPKVTEGES